MERKRRNELSALNVLFCLLVMFIHIISYPIAEFQTGTLKYNLCMLPWRFSSFVVQGFILLSGLKLFLNGKDEMPYGKYLKSRLLSVILPYTVCYIVYYAAYMVVYSYPLDVLFILKNYVTGGLVCHLYFIPLLFQFDLLLPLWKKLVNNVSGVIVIPAALFITLIFENSFAQMLSGAFPNFVFVYNDRLFTTYIGYWLIGCYIGKNYDAFLAMLKNNFKAVTGIFIFTLVLNGYVSYLAYNYVVSIPYV
ncbi:MAG: acyltransferase, partial [Clostridia bacterium]|nr:acyltransferase [Clostridia bacterium]